MRYVGLGRDNLRSHFVFRPRHAPEWLRAWFLPVVFLTNEEELTGKTFTTSLTTTNSNTYVKFIFLRTSPLNNSEVSFLIFDLLTTHRNIVEMSLQLLHPQPIAILRLEGWRCSGDKRRVGLDAPWNALCRRNCRRPGMLDHFHWQEWWTQMVVGRVEGTPPLWRENENNHSNPSIEDWYFLQLSKRSRPRSVT